MVTYLICSYVVGFVSLWILNFFEGRLDSKEATRLAVISMIVWVFSPLTAPFVFLLMVATVITEFSILFGIRRR